LSGWPLWDGRTHAKLLAGVIGKTERVAAEKARSDEVDKLKLEERIPIVTCQESAVFVQDIRAARHLSH
jgi:hypothetical protein